MKTALALRHVAFEDLGLLAPLLTESGWAVRYCEIGVDVVSTEDVLAADLLVILGGPIGVYEQADYPFLEPEIAAVRRRLLAGDATLGICLGAQIMAAALGARVYPSGVKELGWLPLEITPAGRASPLAPLADGTPVLHWHGDTFDLPDGAELLAATPLCRHQAFRWGRHALGLQFHLEAVEPGLERWLIGHTGELAALKRSIPALRAENRRHSAHLAPKARDIFRHWLLTATEPR